MSTIMNSLYNMRLLDNVAQKKTAIHRLHPLVKLVTTVVYLTIVISFGKYEIDRLLPFVFYPILLFAFGEVPVAPILKRVLLIEPFIIGIGILNPVFDNQTVMLGNFAIAAGWITFLSIFIKSTLTVTCALLLIATTGMDNLAASLRMLKIPRLFVLQLLLTYRYIYVLTEEVARILRAYSLRAPNQKGVRRDAWGPLIGQLVLRTFERAQRIYQAMCLRGFDGEYHTGFSAKINMKDLAYLFGWIAFFIVARIYNLPVLLGTLLLGVMK